MNSHKQNIITSNLDSIINNLNTVIKKNMDNINQLKKDQNLNDEPKLSNVNNESKEDDNTNENKDDNNENTKDNTNDTNDTNDANENNTNDDKKNDIKDYESIDSIINICDSLIDQNYINNCKLELLNKDIKNYENATILLGYFSQLQNFKSEFDRFNTKLINFRKNILNIYVNVLNTNHIKELSIPSNNNKLYKKGIHKFNKVKNYIVYHYKQKLYNELDLDNKQINKIREIVYTIIKLDKYYNIYKEIIIDFQLKNEIFDEIMKKHLTEFIYF